MSSKTIALIFLSLFGFLTSCRHPEEYAVYALKFAEGGMIQAKDWVPGADPDDSVDVCNMFWLIQGKDGRNILVDAGFIDSTGTDSRYVRPDRVLERLNIKPGEITDIILTHPHPDHIGGITLFPKATIWMQKDDYGYFTGLTWQGNGDSTLFVVKDVQNLLAAKSEGRVRLTDGDDVEIMPGIKVFTGSRHTFENQFLVVNRGSQKNQVLLASDAIWFYLNFEKSLPVSICVDPAAYVNAIKRMKTLADPGLIVPGHDNLVFSRFPVVKEGIVKIAP